MNYEQEIKDLKVKIDTAQLNKVKAETRLEQLENDRNALLEQLSTLGVEPENLDAHIENLEQEIAQLLEEAKSLLPDD